MKSGLEGRNNHGLDELLSPASTVSMKSGLEGRNNSIEQLNLFGLYTKSQ